MKQKKWTRLLSLLLAACLVLGMVPTAPIVSAAGPEVRFEAVSADQISAELRMDDQTPDVQEDDTDPDAMVRVSIVLEKVPVLDKGFSTMNIGTNPQAQAYRQALLADQQAVIARIISATGTELDVAWNLTLAANVISANVRYGDLEAIEATRGVARVVRELRYEPCLTEGGQAEMNMVTASTMTGSNLAWQAGYTGAGSRIAVIDTGLDTDHQSVDNDAFLHALEGQDADLLDVSEISGLLSQLNIYKGFNDVDGAFKKDESLTAEQLFVSDKIPFGYNYIDRDLDVTHDNDSMGGHGSHVAGIAAANRYLKNEEGFVDAAETALMVGAAPDAQILVMKVFGKDGGAYESDYIAAIEDAIVLGSDVINLSLGSSVTGFTTTDLYQEVFDRLAQTDTVVAISAGNNYAWAEYSTNGYLYADDVNFHTGGSPGTYDNAFTVASVDNCGLTGYAFQAAGRDVVYAEVTDWYTPSLTTMDTEGDGTEYSYVFLDSLGYPADYEGIDVTGNIVFISRGESSFSEKKTAAYNAGAVACVIYNNVPGAPINMDLSSCYYQMPCVSISQTDAAAIREASEAVTGEDGAVLYRTGAMTVGSSMAASIGDAENLTMSQFSSWGPTGALTLKPEITTPGGNIYSIDGATYETDQYTIMSGTSMAAPHAAGVTALLYQYLEETGLAEKLEVSPRVLAQSLLMSTATPIRDSASGLPYPVIRQGAGLANIMNVMNAESYILVDGQTDGKVKAELGDDPERTGTYSFTYTLHNMTDAHQRYTLDGSIYTQGWLQDELGQYYTDYAMTGLDAQLSFCADGKAVEPENGTLGDWDLNGDGAIDQLDAQAILDFAVGKVDSLENQENADLSGDGVITAYDAELLLKALGSVVVELPSGGSVEIEVTVKLTDEAKAQLDEVFANGAYIEGYITATPMADAEGVLASAHSIPMLAFYGGWDESSMFDRVTHTQLDSGTNTHSSYVPGTMFGVSDYNYVLANDGTGDYYLGGNPYAEEAEYLPERNAISSDAAVTVTAMNFNLIRNAGVLRASIVNGDTGEVYARESFDQIYASFFFPNYGTWQNYNQSVVPETETGWAVTDRSGAPLAEGTQVDLTLQAAPEYYVNSDGSVDWDALDADGTSMTLPLTVDNTTPVLSQVSVGTETDVASGTSYDFVEAVVTDNRYTAAVLLLTPGGTKVVGRTPANQTELGAEMRVRLDITGIFGTTFMLAVVDYAGNAAYYQVYVSEPYTGPVGTLYGATNSHNSADWVRFASNTNYDYELIQETTQSISGAVYADGYVFYSSTRTSGYSSEAYLYVADYPNLQDPVEVGPVSGSPYYSAPINDLAYNSSDGNLYFIKSGALYSLDVADASETFVANLELNGYDPSGMAYSEKDDCFYLLTYLWNYNYDLGQAENLTKLTRFALRENGEAITPEEVADLGIWPSYGGNLVVDDKQDAVYILRNRNFYSELLTYSLADDTLTITGQCEPYSTIFLPDEATADANGIVRTDPTSISMSKNAMNVVVSGSKTLSAQVGPWCLADKGVVWTSSDPTVADVDENGCVTGVSEGTATITAASVLDESLTASCEVTVIGTGFTFQAVGTTAEGSSELFTYDLGSSTVSGSTAVTDMDGNALPVAAATMENSGIVWVQDTIADEEGSGYRLHGIDPAIGASTVDTEPNTNAAQKESLLFSDLMYDDWNDIMMGVNGDARVYMTEYRNANTIGESWFNQEGAIVALTKGDTWQYYMDKYTRLYFLDADNQKIVIADLSYSTFFGSWTISMEHCPLSESMTFLTDANGAYQDSMAYDAVTATPILFHYTEDGMEIYAMALDDTNRTFQPLKLGMLEGYADAAVYSAVYSGSAAAADDAPNAILGEPICAVTAAQMPAQGSANAAAELAPSEEKDLVTLTLRAEEAVASGMLQVTLDEGLELIGLESPAMLSSWRNADGVIDLAYAGTEPIAVGDVIAVLRLKHTDAPANASITETERSGENVDVTTVVEIVHDCPGDVFVDLGQDAWYHEYIDYMLEQGLMNGISGECFDPDGTVNRAMAVTVLYRLAGEPEVTNDSAFADVEENAWFADAVVWAEALGIAKGVSQTLFAPGNAVTREQLATFLYRYAQTMGLDVSDETDLTEYVDGADVSAFALDAMAWAAGAEILKGDDLGRLLPQDTANRAELAAIIYRFAE